MEHIYVLEKYILSGFPDIPKLPSNKSLSHLSLAFPSASSSTSEIPPELPPASKKQWNNLPINRKLSLDISNIKDRFSNNKNDSLIIPNTLNTPIQSVEPNVKSNQKSSKNVLMFKKKNGEDSDKITEKINVFKYKVNEHNLNETNFACIYDTPPTQKNSQGCLISPQQFGIHFRIVCIIIANILSSSPFPSITSIISGEELLPETESKRFMLKRYFLSFLTGFDSSINSSLLKTYQYIFPKILKIFKETNIEEFFISRFALSYSKLLKQLSLGPSTPSLENPIILSSLPIIRTIQSVFFFALSLCCLNAGMLFVFDDGVLQIVSEIKKLLLSTILDIANNYSPVLLVSNKSVIESDDPNLILSS
jgi:hypothetical protein